MEIDFGALATHVACALGALKGYGHGDTAAAQSLQYVEDELMKLYEAAKATQQPDEKPEDCRAAYEAWQDLPETNWPLYDPITADLVWKAWKEAWIWPIEKRQPMREAGWQPIEAAPKDGTKILILIMGSVYSAEYGNSLMGIEGWFQNERRIEYSSQATHWMPLPEIPRRGTDAE